MSPSRLFILRPVMTTRSSWATVWVAVSSSASTGLVNDPTALTVKADSPHPMMHRAEALDYCIVIEGEMKLEVGNHIIEVELLDATGKVVVRASVPFERPAGEQVSVVAQTAPAAAAAAASPEQAEFERLRISLTKAMTILENLFANGQKPALEQAAAARSATEIGLQSIAAFRAGPNADPAFIAAVDAHAAKAREALALLQPIAAGDVDALGAVLPKLVALIRDLLNEPTPAATAAPGSKGSLAPSRKCRPCRCWTLSAACCASSASRRR